MLHLRPTLAGLLVLLWSQAISIVNAAKHDGGCNLFMCMNVTLVDQNTMEFAIKPIHEPFGWVGLGWGRQMKNTHMVVFYDDDEGSTILSHRFAKGHEEPLLEPFPRRRAILTHQTVDESQWESKSRLNYSTITFTIPRDQYDPNPGTMIWAYSIRRPESNPSADLTGHYVAGTFNMRLDQQPVYRPGRPAKQPGDTKPPTGEKMPVDVEAPADDSMPAESSGDLSSLLPHNQKIMWHGLLLSVGFLVLLPAGSLIARWSRTFTPRWFRAHRIVNFYVALPVIACGWILGPLIVFEDNSQHFFSAHKFCGLLLFGLYIAQLFLGRYIHSKRSVDGRKPHPPMNILHVGLGISVIALAFFQVRSGLGQWAAHSGQVVSKWYQDAWAGWVVLLPILYFGGFALLKRQFAQERKGETYDDAPGGKNYISLASTPVFDAEEMDSAPGYSELESGVPLLRRAQ